MSDKNGLTYKDAGVDIDAGEALVARIAPAARSTRRSGADADLGGFGGLFDLAATGFKDPILVAATDGVGTKLKIAIDTGLFDGLGQDLVAMCVNDLVVQGAEPLFFLDYYATGKLEVDGAARVVEGIARACKESGCALIGGETAEMPGLYKKGDFDLAGFSVGAVERGAILPKLAEMVAGDVLIGVASSGVHSNGFSLVRKVVETSGLRWDADAPFAAGQKLGAALLTPTRVYVKSALEAGIATLVIPHKGKSREEFDGEMDVALQDAGVELAVLAGFMRILSDGFVRGWEGRLINIHPSLLPAYKGTQVHERVIAAGETSSGASVHFVVPELDAGPVIAQATVPVHPTDTAEALAARVLEIEHKLYPAAVRLLAEDKVKLEKGLAVFS